MMDIQKSALLLVGSPRGSKSISEYLGIYLVGKLREKGIETEKVHLYSSMKSDEEQKHLFSSIDRSDILILTFPLYVDSLPALVTKVLEMISGHRESIENPRRHQFVAIANNGFPEAHQNDTAIAICHRFARETGMEWAGSLSVGGGEGIGFIVRLFGGRPMEKLGFFSKKERNALDLITEFLTASGNNSEEVTGLRTNRPMPSWMYVIGGTVFDWRYRAWKNKVWNRLYDRPYQG
jgi:hypothetical protein